MTLTFTITGPPRTKKNHSRIVMRGKYPKLLPSEAYAEWHKLVIGQATAVALQSRAVCPIDAPVNVKATFYRERLSGDAVGYYQALADLMQDAGIVTDDKWIVSWDGTRLAKDASCPRIEVEVRQVGLGQGGLF